MRKPLRLTLYCLGILALLALTLYMLSGTTFRLTSDEGLVIERKFPAATCRKVLTREFPFVQWECVEQAPPAVR